MGNSWQGGYYNAMQLMKLGWRPASTLKTYTIGTQPATYTLDCVEEPNGSIYAIKIATSIPNRTYWIECREPIGFDGYFPESAQVRVSAPFESASGSDDTQLAPGGVLSNGGTYSDMIAAVQITVGSTTPPPPPPPPTAWGVFYTDTFDTAPINPRWTQKGGTWSIGNGVVTSVTSSDPMKLMLADATCADNQEIVAKVQLKSWAGGDMARAGVSVRNDGNGIGYNLLFHNSNVQFLNDLVAWGNAYPLTGVVGTWYWFKLHIENNVLTGKVWTDGSTEPSTWPYTQSGWTNHPHGCPGLNGGSNNAATANFDNVTISVPQ
jgi:hypothetical protein